MGGGQSLAAMAAMVLTQGAGLCPARQVAGRPIIMSLPAPARPPLRLGFPVSIKLFLEADASPLPASCPPLLALFLLPAGAKHENLGSGTQQQFHKSSIA
jgi:hypothetical protein